MKKEKQLKGKVYYLSQNRDKIREFKDVFKDRFGVDDLIEGVPPEDRKNDHEIQSFDVKEIVKDKVINGYRVVGMPVFVEHTSLIIHGFDKDFPGGQTQPVWDALGEKSFAELFGGRRATAVSSIGFCDGKTIKVFQGKIQGVISPCVAGDSKFQWDTVFIPKEKLKNGLIPIPCESNRYTFAELKEKKRDYSMRTISSNKFMNYLSNVDFFDGKLHDNLEESYNKNISILKELMKKDELILFVGAGVSRGVGMPLWNQLTKELVESMQVYNNDLNYNVIKGLGNDMEIAEFIAGSTKGDSKRDNHHLKTYHQTLKNHFTLSDDIKEKIEKSLVYRFIYDLNFKKIYTTNYDDTLIYGHKYFNSKLKDNRTIDKVIGESHDCKYPHESTKIYKFHGDIDNPHNIVLKESDYFERLNFNTFMDRELMKDMRSKSILFIGYKLGDPNIRLMINQINQQYDNVEYSGKKPQSYILVNDHNIVNESNLRLNRIVPIIGKSLDPGDSLETFLYDLLTNQRLNKKRPLATIQAASKGLKEYSSDSIKLKIRYKNKRRNIKIRRNE